MAKLHYENLGLARPQRMMDDAYYRLRTFHQFLSRTKNYMESDAALKRLAWRPHTTDGAPREPRPSREGVWVQLEEAPGRPDEPESTFRAFMEETVREVYEDDAPGDERKRRPSSKNDKFSSDRKIRVLDRDQARYALKLEREPESPQLVLRPNTTPLFRQIRAIETLQSRPLPSHLPLLRLVENEEHAWWPEVEPASLLPDDWMVLTDPRRAGTEEQREFVERALTTPDFAFLEGPPGSGKTTAICELVLQLAKQGKRALLCASTHVAVDNVLERLMDEEKKHRHLVIPVRIGDAGNVSEKAKRWQLERFARTERERLLHHLDAEKAPSDAQIELRDSLREDASPIERMVLDAANLVCGTTIGILQHPDIKNGGNEAAQFDVLILDEASKTTFPEFLVPALHAKRWIIVGDPKQLSPYVDEDAMKVNLEACLPDEELRDACVDVFMAMHEGISSRRLAVRVPASFRARDTYLVQGEARGVDVTVVHEESERDRAQLTALVVGEGVPPDARFDRLSLEDATLRASRETLDTLRARKDHWRSLPRHGSKEAPSWAAEVGWRLVRAYDLRLASDLPSEDERRASKSRQLEQQIEALLPDEATGTDVSGIRDAIDRVRRVALPSVLETLMDGFERDPGARRGCALSDGLPESALEDRHVLLSTQHRMHADVAAFSHEHIYEGEALITAPNMTVERAWTFDRYASRAVWLDVRGGFDRKSNSNAKEAGTVIEELERFDEWCAKNPRKDGRAWEAAVLTFYRGQEREIRGRLREWTRQRQELRHFVRGKTAEAHLTVELCTVDRFQGHEADLVLLSLANNRSTSFLQSPNRLNVALTRARYQRITVGDRQAMAKGANVLAAFANAEPWERAIGRAER